MAIYRMLKETAFDAETVEAMGHAYEDLLRDLGLADRNDPFTQIVAKEIIKVASRGAREHAQIRAMVFDALGGEAPIARAAGAFPQREGNVID